MLEVTIIAPTMEAGEQYRDGLRANRAEAIRCTIATPGAGHLPIEGMRCHELHVLHGLAPDRGNTADLLFTAHDNLSRTGPRPHPLSA